MLIFSKVQDIQNWLSQSNKRIGFVPTMGALHEGHSSLIKECHQKNDLSIVSIFVNPLQFAPNEDLSKYPNTIEADLELCRQENISAVFLPNKDEMYPHSKEFTTKLIPPEKLVNCLCGLSRPSHFEGVLTIVLKLFNILKPNNVYFGEKDYQQLILIKKMVYDLNLNINIIPMPIVRAESGLALSSRNKYLNEEQKELASKLYFILQTVQKLISENYLLKLVLKDLQEKYCHELDFEYFEARDSETLDLKENAPARLFIASKIGSARLIDNIELFQIRNQSGDLIAP